MKTPAKILSQFKPSWLAGLLLVSALVPAAHAGSRTSASYGIPADTADGGGRHTTSAAYSNDGSLGNVAGSSTSAAFTLGSGYVAQLQSLGAPVVGDLVASGTYNTLITPITIVGTNSPTTYGAVGLPSGLTPNPFTGVITGTPTAAGVFSVTISATNANGTGTGTLTLTIAKASQTITFAGPPSQPFNTNPIALSGTASSGLTVSFNVVGGPGSVTGTSLTLTGAGTVVIRASQSGDANYSPAPNVNRNLVVTAAIAGDINGDGMADIAWKNSSSGDVSIWLMNGTGFASWVDVGSVPPEWQIAALADFNGDGNTDILWENTVTGDRGFWLMNGSVFASWVDIGIVTTDWHIAGAGDFNGDGKPDILWENTVSGDRCFWLMNGTGFSSWQDIGIITTALHIVAVGDFNADGKPDIVWENTATGKRVIWLMNGTTFSTSVNLGIVPTEWHIAAVADYNGDGKPDILWENTVTGERGFYLMNGTVFQSWVSLGIVPTDWRIAP